MLCRTRCIPRSLKTFSNSNPSLETSLVLIPTLFSSDQRSEKKSKSNWHQEKLSISRLLQSLTSPKMANKKFSSIIMVPFAQEQFTNEHFNVVWKLYLFDKIVNCVKVMIKNKKASASLNLHPKAGAKLGSVGAPMPGEVLNIPVQVGDKVTKGQIIATLR